MGVESAAYRFVPTRGGSGAARDALIAAGAEVIDSHHLVLHGGGSWIDVQLDRPAPTVGLRIAFSNPETVVSELREVWTALAASGHGDVLDTAAHGRFSIDDKARMEEMLEDFKRRRQAFQRDFGPIEAAVSAEAVFRLIREHRGDN